MKNTPTYFPSTSLKLDDPSRDSSDLADQRSELKQRATTVKEGLQELLDGLLDELRTESRSENSDGDCSDSSEKFVQASRSLGYCDHAISLLSQPSIDEADIDFINELIELGERTADSIEETSFRDFTFGEA